MQAQIDRIKSKLAELRKSDPEFKIFGASLHKYQFNPAKTENELLHFEKEASEEELEEIEDEYFELKWANGLLRICDFGWSATVNLFIKLPDTSD